MMATAEQIVKLIPFAVVGLLDLRLKSGDSPRDAIAAALAAWPGAETETYFEGHLAACSALILPLTENANG